MSQLEFGCETALLRTELQHLMTVNSRKVYCAAAAAQVQANACGDDAATIRAKRLLRRHYAHEEAAVSHDVDDRYRKYVKQRYIGVFKVRLFCWFLSQPIGS